MMNRGSAGKRHTVDNKGQRNTRSRFKRIVRTIMLNQQWLDDPDDAPGISMNVKKNVAFLVRPKRKIGILTMSEKTLLRSLHLMRTVGERKKLSMILASMSCFTRLPPKLRARLVPVVKFATLNVDRVLVKENDFPILVYFLVSGEIEMKKTVYDKSTKVYSQIPQAILGPGDWIGDVELIEDCPRMNTYVVTAPCEVLSVTDDEFKRILGPLVRKQWHEKKRALKSLHYFDHFNHDQMVRACNYCQMIQYNPMESIFPESKGADNYVHFVLSGECVILQCLQLRVMKVNGEISYQLEDVESGKEFDTSSKYSNIQAFGNSMKMLDSKVNINDILESAEPNEIEREQMDKARRKMGLKEVEAACAHLNELNQPKKRNTHQTSVVRRTLASRLKPHISESIDSISLSCELWSEEYEYEYLTNLISSDEDIEFEDHSFRPSSAGTVRIKLGDMVVMQQRSSSTTISSPASSISSIASRKGLSLVPEADDLNEPDEGISETHFIDVGSLTFGGIFGLGESLYNRIIMSRNVVQCLLLPRHWLLTEAQNPGNIWHRRQFYLKGSIPSHEQVFEHFRTTRSWEKYRREHFQQSFDPDSVHSGRLEDVPLISRIVANTEGTDHAN